MFERFTDRARRVLVIAQEEARLFDHDYIGTEHFLAALLHEGEGVGARALEAAGADLAALRATIEESAGRPANAGFTGSPPFTPEAKKVLELSLREALQLGHNYIGTEHLLLALCRDGECSGARVLKAVGISLTDLREEVIRLIRGYAGGDPMAVESDRVEKTDLPIGANALLGSEEARALISSWLRVDPLVVQDEIGGIMYESCRFRSSMPPEILLSVVGGKVTKEAFDGYTRLIPDAEEVPNLGDAAAFSGQRHMLRVLSGTTVIVVRVPNHPRPRDATIEVARRALANLAGP